MADVFIVRLLATTYPTNEVSRTWSCDSSWHLLDPARPASSKRLRRLSTNLQEMSRGWLRNPRGNSSSSPRAPYDHENLPRLSVGLSWGGEKIASRWSATREDPTEHTERETWTQQEVQSDREGIVEGEFGPGCEEFKLLIESRLQRKSKYTDARLKSLKAKNEYQLCLEASNTTIHKYFVEDLSDLIDVSSANLLSYLC